MHHLKDTGSLIMNANILGVAKNTVGQVVHEVCYAISKYLGPKYLFLPRNKGEMKTKVFEFEAKTGTVKAFDCADGMLIPISCSSEN